MPSISAEDAPRLKPYMKLAEQLGSFAGQIADGAYASVSIEYEGTVAELNTKPLTALILANLLQSQLENVNFVNAFSIAEARGMSVRESHMGSSKDWRSVINLYVATDTRTFNVTGTLFTGKEPRIVNIEGVPVEAALSSHMLFIRNNDTPGVVGRVGTLLGDAGQNIADFRLGRQEGKNKAVCLVSLDQALPDAVFSAIASLPQIESAVRLRF